MTDFDALRQIYETLADRYADRGEPPLRDAFLVLAADIALASERNDEAERLRQKLLRANPRHLVSPYPTFAAAAKAMDVRDYIADLRNQFPPERAEELLHLPREMPTVRGSSDTLRLKLPAPIEGEATTVDEPTILISPPAPAEPETIPHRWIATTLLAAFAFGGGWLAYVSLLRPFLRV
jgi:hypothetical protein